MVPGPHRPLSPRSKRGLFQTFQQTVASSRLWSAAERLIVGVSGGADSTALLHLLCSAGYAPVVAHLNHGLRGAASDADEKFVHQLCRRWGLIFDCGRVDVAGEAGPGESIEEAARRIRYDFFADVAREHGAKKILVAHTQNDQAETFLIRLLRGSGRRGLGGMKMVSPLPVPGSKCLLIRPLLRTPRASVQQYLARNHLRHREDATNSSDRFLRSRIRRKLIPLLQGEFQPAAVEVLARAAEILGEEDQLLDQEVRAFARRPKARRSSLMKLPSGLRGRALLRWLEAGGHGTPSRERLEAILSAAEKEEPRGRRIQLARGKSLWLENDALRVEGQ